MHQSNNLSRNKQKSQSQRSVSSHHRKDTKIDAIKQCPVADTLPCNIRQLDNLYANICEKKLKPKQFFKRMKSDPAIIKISQIHEIKEEESSKKQKTSSIHYQIHLSNYRQLLRESFHNNLRRDDLVDSLQQKYMFQLEENQQLKNQNQKLKKIVQRQVKQSHKKEKRIHKLENYAEKLIKKSQNIINESQIREVKMKTEIKLIRYENLKYKNLVDALKESIKILNGKQIKELSSIWKEWQSIFQLASLQQCNIKRKQDKI